MVKRFRSSSAKDISENETKSMKRSKFSTGNFDKTKNEGNNNNVQLEFLVTYFKDLIAHRNRDPAVLRREDLWQDVVENFAQLVRLLSTMSDDVIDFKLVGSALLCSTEFYVAELESLSNDVYKLSTSLQRSEAKHQREDHAVEEVVKHVVPIPEKKKNTPSSRHTIKRILTVVDPKLLNAKLETNPLSSPIFQKINSKIGDMCNPGQFIRNTLPPSHTNFHVDKKFWSTSEESSARNLECPHTIALPIKMFRNFTNLRIRREIDYTVLSRRRGAVANDMETWHTDKLAADSCIQSDDEALEDEEMEGSENDVDENLNNILSNVGDDSEHENINEIANLVEARHHDVDEDEEEKINPTNLLSAHENLQLLSSSLIDLSTTGKIYKWRGEDKKNQKNRKISLRDIEANMENFNSELIILDNPLISVESINHRNWKKDSLKLKLPLHESLCKSLFDTFAYSIEAIVDSGIVSDVSLHDLSTTHDCANYYNQLSELPACSDTFACLSPSNSDFDDLVILKPQSSSTPLQGKFAGRESMKRIENETIVLVNQMEGEPVKFSKLYSDVSRSLSGETSCALTFFSVLRAASSGEGDNVKVILRNDENSVQDFYVQSVHTSSKRKNLFDCNFEDSFLSLKKRKFCED